MTKNSIFTVCFVPLVVYIQSYICIFGMTNICSMTTKSKKRMISIFLLDLYFIDLPQPILLLDYLRLNNFTNGLKKIITFKIGTLAGCYFGNT